MDSLLQHYNYRDMLHLANTFASLLIAKKLASHKRAKKIDLIIPMPMHPSRLQARGFNQALELARIIAKKRNYN